MVVRCKETDTEAICMFWVGVWGGGGYVLVGFLVFFFFLENLLCSNIPIVHGFRGLDSCDNPVFPEISGNFIVDFGANRLPFILSHSIKLDPP